MFLKQPAIPFVFLSGTFMPMEQERATLMLGTDSYFSKTGDIAVMMERVQSMLKLLPRLPGEAPSEESQT